MSVIANPEMTTIRAEDLKALPAWLALKAAVVGLQQVQVQDGSVPEPADHDQARRNVGIITDSINDLRHHLPHDTDYLELLVQDLQRWASEGFAVPDFLDSLVAFHPEQWRIDGLPHLVLFPMYTQNGSTNRYFEAVLIEVIWPSFVAELEAGSYSNNCLLYTSPSPRDS